MIYAHTHATCIVEEIIIEFVLHLLNFRLCETERHLEISIADWCYVWAANEEFLFFAYSGIKGQLCVPLLYRQGWLWQGVASREKKGQEVLRDEGDEQGKNNNKAQCQVCHQREANSGTAEEPLHSQHVLRILRPREPISGHGLLIRRRLALPYLPSQALL